MKRTLICLSIALSLCFLSGCAKEEPILLTPDNIQNYLQFNTFYDNYSSHTNGGILFTYADVTFEVYPKVPGKLSNVNIKVEITFPKGWTVTSSDPAYIPGDAKRMVLSITLPADGKYTTTHNIGNLMIEKPYTSCSINILSVSGSFIEE